MTNPISNLPFPPLSSSIFQANTIILSPNVQTIRDPIIISKPYEDILSKYLSQKPTTKTELKEELKKLETSVFEDCFREITNLYLEEKEEFEDEDDDEGVDECIKIIFFHGMSFFLNGLENQKLKDKNYFAGQLSNISLNICVGRLNLSYFLLLKNRHDLASQDLEMFVKKVTKDLQRFVRFPEILKKIKDFHDSSLQEELSEATCQFFWYNDQAIDLLDVLLSCSYSDIVYQLAYPEHFNNNKEILIQIIQLLKKYSRSVECIRQHIVNCFKEIKEIDFENGCLTCTRPNEKLAILATELSMKTIKFIKTPDSMEEQVVDRFENIPSEATFDDEVLPGQQKRKKRPRSEELGLDNDTNTKAAKQTKLDDQDLPSHETDFSTAVALTPESVLGHNPENSQPEIQTNQKKRKREVSPSEDDGIEIKAAKLRKLAENDLKPWSVFFKSCRNAKFTIDLSEIKNFSLEHLSLLSRSEPVHLHLNAQILDNNRDSRFSFDCPFLKVTWHIVSPIDDYHIEKIRHSKLIELKINASLLDEESAYTPLTKINPENIALFVNDDKPSNITLKTIQTFTNLKRVRWEIPLATSQQRAICSYLIDKGVNFLFNSLIADFNPRENLQEETDEVKLDVIHCVKIVDYFVKNTELAHGLSIQRLVLTDFDTHLLTQFPLAGLVSLNTSTYDLTRIDSRTILKTLEAELLRFLGNKLYSDSGMSCSPQRFQQIFTKESVALYPKLASIFWLYAANHVETSSEILFFLDTFHSLISQFDEKHSLDSYYKSYTFLLNIALRQNLPIENLSDKLEFLYKFALQEQNISSVFLNCLLNINPPEITQEYIKLFTLALKKQILHGFSNLSYLSTQELKRLLPALLSAPPQYNMLVTNVVNYLPIDQMSTQDLKYWVPLAERTGDSVLKGKIIAHFDKCHRFLSAETKRSYAKAILGKKCSIEFFEPAFRILVNYSTKFPPSFIEYHIENLLKFISKYRTDSVILIKVDHLLNTAVPNQPSSFINEVLIRGLQIQLTAEQEENFCQIFENCFVIPKKIVNLPAVVPSETLTRKMGEICKKHSFYYPFIMPWLIEFAINSENPLQECIRYIEAVPTLLTENLWTKIFSKPSLKQEIMNRFFENSIHNARALYLPEPLLQGLAANILLSEDNIESSKEITKFIRFTNKLVVLCEHSFPNPIQLPPSLITPLLEIVEKENLVVSYSLGISRLLSKCVGQATLDLDTSTSFFNILMQLKKAKKDSVTKEEKNKYKRHSTFIYNSLAVELNCLTMHGLTENIFLFCLSFLEKFQDQLLGDDSETLKELILRIVLSEINKGFNLSIELTENLSTLLLSRKNTTTMSIQNSMLAQAFVKKFLSRWEANLDHQIISAANFSILIDCLTFPREESEQQSLSEILSNFGLITFNNLIIQKHSNFSQNPLFCKSLLDCWANKSLLPNVKGYVYSFIGITIKSGLFEDNKESILRLINSNLNTITDFSHLFPDPLTSEQLFYISSTLVNQPSISKEFSHSKLQSEEKTILFHLSRFVPNFEAIKQKASEIAQVEIVLPPGGETLDLEEYLEYFKCIDKEIVQTYASPELIESAKRQNTTCYELYLDNLKNLIIVLTKNQPIELAPIDEEERRNFYSTIIHDLKASLFHIHSHVSSLSKEETLAYLNQNAQVFITLAEAGKKGNCTYPYQQASQGIYRMVVPQSNLIEMDVEKIEERIIRKVLEFVWVCVNKVMATDPRSINVHTQNAYIKFFEGHFGHQINSTKVIKEDPLLLAELEILRKREKEIYSKFQSLFNLKTCFNFICENWGHIGTDPKESYNLDHLNVWLEEYAKEKKLAKVPYPLIWNKNGSFPWPGLLEILISLKIFQKRFPEETTPFNLNLCPEQIQE